MNSVKVILQNRYNFEIKHNSVKILLQGLNEINNFQHKLIKQKECYRMET